MYIKAKFGKPYGHLFANLTSSVVHTSKYGRAIIETKYTNHDYLIDV